MQVKIKIQWCNGINVLRKICLSPHPGRVNRFILSWCRMIPLLVANDQIKIYITTSYEKSDMPLKVHLYELHGISITCLKSYGYNQVYWCASMATRDSRMSPPEHLIIRSVASFRQVDVLSYLSCQTTWLNLQCYKGETFIFLGTVSIY